MNNSDTIAAIGTPFGTGGIGIVRISGPHAFDIASHIFMPRNPLLIAGDTDSLLIAQLQSHRLYLGHIIDSHYQYLDEVLLTIMRAPHSYTCENVVEIQSHSGRALLKSILNLVVDHGARLAQPGEFTKRAFLNGRIDLTQAEATIDLINAQSSHALQIANSQMQGHLQKSIAEIKSAILQCSMQIEVAIDFPDEIDESILPDDLIHNLQTKVADSIEQLLQHHASHGFIREGLRIAIIGAPNVGKSSLMNCLLNQDRSIVTAFPGTTRDIIEDSFQLQGMPIIISDTAGIHTTADPIETIGIQRTQAQIQKADLILYVIEAQLVQDNLLSSFIREFQMAHLIIVINKIDLIEEPFKIDDLNHELSQFPHVKISALFNKGIDNLKRTILETVRTSQLDPTIAVVPNLRHATNLKHCQQSILSAIKLLADHGPAEIISLELTTAVEQLDEILGTNIKVDILDLIFDNFCIGK